MKAPQGLINDLKAVFDKYEIWMDVADDYNAEEICVGQTIEIKSKVTVDDELLIYIDDMEELAEKINS